MMIGPAPMMRTEWMSVRLGISLNRLSAFGFFLCFAGHRHEAHRERGSFFQAVSLFAEQYQFMIPVKHDGEDHTEAVLELLGQRLWHVLGRASDDDRVERRRLGPAFVSVSGADRHVF